MKIKKRWLILLSLIVLCGISIYFLTRPKLTFQHQKEVLELHQAYDPYSFIEKINGYNKEDIKINDSQVDMNKIGKYQLTYSIQDKEYVLDVEVVDTKSPTFDVKDIEIELGTDLTCDQVIENIKDETTTKSYFKENYDFKQVGKQKVIVVVEDEGHNKTEKEAIVNVVKDNEKPTLQGLKDRYITVGTKINYLKGVTAKDNFDPKPQIEVNSTNVDVSKVGQYEVQYTVKDRSGNQNTYTKKVIVQERKPVTTITPTGDKIVYLTFDDGPSINTKRVLDILDRYNAKATFFVTGNGQSYHYLIKEAHQRGHTIGLHTYSHNYAQVYQSVDQYFADLDRIGNIVQNQIGFVPRYIRFPGGSSNTVSRKHCKGIMTTLVSEVQNRGYQYYDWNVSSGDASGNNVPVSTIVRNCTSSNANNIMILCHDIRSKNTTVEALPQVIEHYQSLGYVFKGIDDSTFTPHHGVNN